MRTKEPKRLGWWSTAGSFPLLLVPLAGNPAPTPAIGTRHTQVPAARTSSTAAASTKYHYPQDEVPRQASAVTISGRQLLVRKRAMDGTLAPASPYVIRGVNWSPARVGTGETPESRRPEFGESYLTDIPLMRAMNANTVRLFIDPGLPDDSGLSVPGRVILDELYRNGLMVVMTVDDGIHSVDRIPDVVNEYKDHPAVLLWSLGSEWNINLRRESSYFPNVQEAAEAIESAAQVVKSNDTSHPVVSSYGTILNRPNAIEKYVHETCPSIDIWSFNEYRGRGFSRLFDQWRYISTKPMFLGEFGIDAYNSVTDQPDEATHTRWVASLWDDIARNLSATDPGNVALGGFVFEWNDEWWKAGNWLSHDSSGWTPIAFPDGFASEEWWGIVDIDRTVRSLYAALTVRFRETYRAPARSSLTTYRVDSVNPKDVRFFENGAQMYDGLAAQVDDAGGRGFNIAAIDPTTGRLLREIGRFDTWGSRATGEAMRAMIAYLDALPDGSLVLIAVGDEAGLTQDGTCEWLPFDWVADARDRLVTQLGSRLVDRYCYGQQWAMISVKGRGSLREAMPSSLSVTVKATVPRWARRILTRPR